MLIFGVVNSIKLHKGLRGIKKVVSQNVQNSNVRKKVVLLSHVLIIVFNIWCLTHTHTHTHTHIYIYAHTYTCTHTQTHTHTHTHTHTYIYTHTHKWVNTYTHTYIHTYTHTYTGGIPQKFSKGSSRSTSRRIIHQWDTSTTGLHTTNWFSTVNRRCVCLFCTRCFTMWLLWHLPYCKASTKQVSSW